jgi:oligopeptide transport system substrate-binding protein
MLLWPTVVAFASDQATDAENQIIRIALNQEPPQLNSFLTSDSVSMMVLGHVMEGLLRYDRRGRLKPGVAERWDIEAGGATFYLRKRFCIRLAHGGRSEGGFRICFYHVSD